jgi:hypothetical protein
MKRGIRLPQKVRLCHKDLDRLMTMTIIISVKAKKLVQKLRKPTDSF